ncbi:MAG: hypothetical protein J5533_09295 [Bacteroidales bacterium]|nr:hypothetical protein [Bacteroidales bacterium]
MHEIDNYLRENKPVVKDDPTFLLETLQKMKAVEGIKREVDNQRKIGRVVLIVTLAVGLALGAAVSAIAFLCPVSLSSAEVVRALKDLAPVWKYGILLFVAAMATALGLLLTTSRSTQS